MLGDGVDAEVDGGEGSLPQDLVEGSEVLVGFYYLVACEKLGEQGGGVVGLVILRLLGGIGVGGFLLL